MDSATRDGLADERADHGGKVPTVLVVDDDTRFLTFTQTLLRSRRIHVVCARTSRSALSLAQGLAIDLALVDYQLRGRENGLSLGTCLRTELGIPFIMVSQYLTTSLTVQAMKLGAEDCVDKPGGPMLVRAIDAVFATGTFDYLRGQNSGGSADLARADELLADQSAARKLAVVVLRAAGSAKDPHTNQKLARAGGVSTSVFRELARACSVEASRVRDLARLVRVVRLSVADNSAPASHLSARDRRTVARLIDTGGLPPDCRHIDLRTLFQAQRFLPKECEVLIELAHLAANSPLFQDQSWEAS